MPCPFTNSLHRESAGLQKSASPTASDCCGADASICCEIVTSPGPAETTSDAACVAWQGKLADGGIVMLSCVAVAAVTCADTPSIVTTFALGIVLKFWPVIVTLAPACSSVGEIAVTNRQGEPLAGAMLVCDLATMSFRKVRLRRNDQCPVCQHIPSPQATQVPAG